MISCELCGESTPKNSPTQKYCARCKIEKKREWARNWARKTDRSDYHKEYEQRPEIKERRKEQRRPWPVAPEGSVCAICGCDGPLKADHDHNIRKEMKCCYGAPCDLCFRGFVCHVCNTGLGKFRDDPEILRRAATYLESPPGYAN